MNNNEDPELNAPWCCGQKSKFVQQTPKLFYYYCTKCKKEVKPRGDSSYGLGDDTSFEDEINKAFKELEEQLAQAKWGGYLP